MATRVLTTQWNGFQPFTLKNQNRYGRALLEPQHSADAGESQEKPALAKEGVAGTDPRQGQKQCQKDVPEELG